MRSSWRTVIAGGSGAVMNFDESWTAHDETSVHFRAGCEVPPA
jgi:hypothetical protein